MLKRTIISLVLFSTSIVTLPSYATIVVIANPKLGVKQTSANALRNVFLGKDDRIASAVSATPYNLPQDSAAYVAFYKDLFNWTPTQVNQYWSPLIFTGQAEPPATLRNQRAAVAYVAKHSDAIAYVDSQVLNHKVNVIYAFGKYTPKPKKITPRQAVIQPAIRPAVALPKTTALKRLAVTTQKPLKAHPTAPQKAEPTAPKQTKSLRELLAAKAPQTTSTQQKTVAMVPLMSSQTKPTKAVVTTAKTTPTVTTKPALQKSKVIEAPTAPQTLALHTPSLPRPSIPSPTASNIPSIKAGQPTVLVAADNRQDPADILQRETPKHGQVQTKKQHKPIFITNLAPNTGVQLGTVGAGRQNFSDFMQTYGTVSSLLHNNEGINYFSTFHYETPTRISVTTTTAWQNADIDTKIKTLHVVYQLWQQSSHQPEKAVIDVIIGNIKKPFYGQF